ncbi:MAG TPA: glycosyltransferase [Burkholderiales bacterium]|nr:glycosyltransferase [Burkholderiales bacterium]
MPRETGRTGGVCLGLPSEILDEALALFPGARVEPVSLEGEALQARLEQAAYLVLPELDDDPLPRELIDGFANGLPVIAPEDGAAAELIEPGRNGLLFEPSSARELARRLAWAEAFPEKMRQMGECARADYLARFIADWSYRKLYGERRRSARL